MRPIITWMLQGSWLAMAIAGPAAAQDKSNNLIVGTMPATSVEYHTSERFLGRLSAEQKVSVVARISAVVEQRLFEEGQDVAEGTPLYRLESAPYEAAVAQAEGSVAQGAAQLNNANLALAREQSLLATPAGQRSKVDDALALQRFYAGQLVTANAQLRAARVNLAYTEIRAPIAGRIARTMVTPGNVVGPTSGIMTTIISQDPMYVYFSVPVRTAANLLDSALQPALVKPIPVALYLPDGSRYRAEGRIDYVEPSVNQSTDTLMLRAEVPNPATVNPDGATVGGRELADGEFVEVEVERDVGPAEVGVPRVAVLNDEQGSFVLTLDQTNRVRRKAVQVAATQGDTASLTAGVRVGEPILVDNLQRIQPGQMVVPVAIGGKQAPKDQNTDHALHASALTLTNPQSRSTQ